ncbi:uncharacterized protein LOC117338800 [Pecten maximus]|uniref:uncharacterized protein LOC117338800 n=1 Tax=Pecten maximus TaxID=6579 RepID=UPI001458CC19|nr:uncharacterized protein LOC117338800 [Pecten maximus]
MIGYASRCFRRTNFCEVCEGSNPVGVVDEAITSTLAAPMKDEINIALHHLRTSIDTKYQNLIEAHNPVNADCRIGDTLNIPRQNNMNEYLRLLFRKITHVAVKTEYADCMLEEGRSGNYEEVRAGLNRALCALLRRNRTFRNDRKLCSPRYCPLPGQADTSNSERIDFERCTLLESSMHLNSIIASWEQCINDNDETYTCIASSRRRSRRHNEGRKGGRRGRKNRRRGRKGNKSRKALRKRCMKKSGKPRKRCLRKLRRKYKM